MQTQPASDLRMWLLATLPACGILTVLLQLQVEGVPILLVGFAALECGRKADSRFSHAIARYATCFAIAVVSWFALDHLTHAFWPPDTLLTQSDPNGLFVEVEIDWPLIIEQDRRFQSIFAGHAAVIFAACVAGRLRFNAQMAPCAILAIIVYPLFVSWTWGGGWLLQLGFYDFAGGTIVYAIAGWSGLGVAVAFRNAESNDQVTAANHRTWLYAIGGLLICLPATVGTLLPMSLPNVMAHVAVNINIAACGGALSAIVLSWFVFRVWRLHFALGGCFAGLAAITAGVDTIPPAFSLLTGVGAGLLFVAGSWGLRKLSIPDDLGIVSSFGVGGAWGTLCVGMLSRQHALWPQIAGVLMAFVWAFGVFAFAGWLTARLTCRTELTAEVADDEQ